MGDTDAWVAEAAASTTYAWARKQSARRVIAEITASGPQAARRRHRGRDTARRDSLSLMAASWLCGGQSSRWDVVVFSDFFVTDSFF